jgi:hypothetical protein
MIAQPMLAESLHSNEQHHSMSFSCQSESKNWTPDEIISELQSSLTTRKRLSVLKRLRQCLSNTDCTIGDHNENIFRNVSPAKSFSAEAIKLGIVNILRFQLHHLLYRHGSTLTEVQLTCQGLLHLLRGCQRRDIWQEAVMKQGSGLLDLLIDSVYFEKKKKPSSNAWGDSVHVTVLSVLYMVSSFAAGSSMLLGTRSVGQLVVDSLNDETLTQATVADLLGILKNWTYFEEDHRGRLLQTGDLLLAMTALPCRRSFSVKNRQRLSSILRNFMVSIECREIFIREPSAIAMMIQLMTWDPSSPLNSTEKTDWQKQRYNLLDVLISLSMDRDTALALIFHDDGIILTKLKRFLKESADDLVRKKAAQSIRLLAHGMSAPILTKDAELMYLLTDAALHDRCLQVRRESTDAFTRCAALVQANKSPHYQAVLDALTQLTRQLEHQSNVSINMLAQAFKQQSTYECNRAPMVERIELLRMIAKLALSTESPVASEDACSAILNLAMEESKRENLANEPKLLDALVANLFDNCVSVSANSTRKKNVVRTLILLATDPANRSKMARHSCLIQSMISAARSIRSVEMKDELKNAIIMLTNEL